MRLLALFLSFAIICSNPVLAKKSKSINPTRENYLSEFTHIEKLFASPSNKYPLRADIIIPAAADEFQLMVHYDELTDMAIKDISWISGKKSKAILAVRSESNVNIQLEKMVNRSNPGIAYDRMQTNKHVITKTYYFTKSKIFPSKKPEQQTLKITWINNAVIYVPIDHLYLSKAEPSASPKARPTKMGANPNPRAQGQNSSRTPLTNQDMENEQIKQDKQNEYEMLEIESTLKQMKELDSGDDTADDTPQLPEF